MLNSLQMINHVVSPLDLMAAAGHYHAAAAVAAAAASSSSSSGSSVPRIYNTPPPISTSDPLANECKLVDYRGQKVAAFTISGELMLCLPQAVEMFLKDAVGGPHTVYCKLKRLDIEPLVCNVEQVRILRALGAIQPFVNRCKLLSIKDFDILYGDCTTKAISKAGRPAKKILSPSDYCGQSQLKKFRLDSSDYAAFENENLSRRNKLPSSYNSQLNHMALMQINHHHSVPSALMNGSTASLQSLPPPSTSSSTTMQNLPRLDSSSSSMMMIKAAVQAGMSPSEIENIARSGIWGHHQLHAHTNYEDMIQHLERYRLEGENERSLKTLKSNHPILNLSKSNRNPQSDCDVSDKSESLPPSSVHNNDDDDDDDNDEDDDLNNLSDFNVSDDENADAGSVEAVDDDNASQSLSLISENTSPKANSGGAAVNDLTVTAIKTNDLTDDDILSTSSPPLPLKPQQSSVTSQREEIPSPNIPDYDHYGDSNLSVGTLLWNIQTLLKIATDNARQHEKQTSYEKAELKMDFMRERDVKNSLERQLIEERKLRILYQKRFSRERKLGVRLKNRVDNCSKTKI